MADDFTQERDILTFKPNIHYEEPVVDDYEEDAPEEITTLEGARQAVTDLINSYKQIETLAELTQERVDKKVGDYTVKLDPKTDGLVIAAIGECFPEAADKTKISYEMYKQCLARINTEELPKITTKDLLAAKQDPLRTDFSGYGAPTGQNRPEVSSPGKVAEPLDLGGFQDSAVSKLFDLLKEAFIVPYVELRFLRHIATHGHTN